jgi:ATP-binding cassette subfamily F protein 3
LEKSKSELEHELAKPEVYGDVNQLQKVQNSFEETLQKLDAANQSWEELVTELDALD